jgi:vancomycin resistance protein YoaR
MACIPAGTLNPPLRSRGARMNTLVAVLIAFLALRDNGSLEGRPLTVASFSTTVEDQDAAVKKNIAIACGKIHGYVFMPGSVFSFNEVVGEGSARNGYVDGRVLYRDEVRYEPGGGLCQLSSTVFNALLLAGCAIVERHRHFQPVTYVPPGLDATIKYGKKDLRIRNSHPIKLFIEASISDKRLLVEIKAVRPLPRRYEVYTEEEEAEVPLGGETRNVRHGINVSVYRNTFSGESLLESLLLYRDYYPPVYLK